MSANRARLDTTDRSHKRITKAPISSAKLIEITMRNSFPSHHRRSKWNLKKFGVSGIPN
jgi:hypothetical protein